MRKLISCYLGNTELIRHLHPSRHLAKLQLARSDVQDLYIVFTQFSNLKVLIIRSTNQPKYRDDNQRLEIMKATIPNSLKHLEIRANSLLFTFPNLLLNKRVTLDELRLSKCAIKILDDSVITFHWGKMCHFRKLSIYGSYGNHTSHFLKLHHLKALERLPFEFKLNLIKIQHRSKALRFRGFAT